MKKFTGSVFVLFVLLCLGIIPGVIYWAVKQESLKVR